MTSDTDTFPIPPEAPVIRKNCAPPAVIIDTREQTPLSFPPDVRTVRDRLKTGDYSIIGYEDRFTVERKTLSDLVRTVIHERERFVRELERMASFDFRRLLVVAPYAKVVRGPYRFSGAHPRAIVASLAAWEVRYGVPVVFAANEYEAARRIADWVHYYVREREREESADGGNPKSLHALRARTCVHAIDPRPISR